MGDALTTQAIYRIPGPRVPDAWLYSGASWKGANTVSSQIEPSVMRRKSPIDLTIDGLRFLIESAILEMGVISTFTV